MLYPSGLKFYFLPWRFRNFRLYPLVFEILSHALHILKFFTMPSLFRFYVCSIFFLCPFFSFFSLFSFSLSSNSVVTETMICFLVLPSHLVCVVSFSFSFSLLLFWWYLCMDRISVFPLSVDALMSCRFLFSSSSSFSIFSFLHHVVF